MTREFKVTLPWQGPVPMADKVEKTQGQGPRTGAGIPGPARASTTNMPVKHSNMTVTNQGPSNMNNNKPLGPNTRAYNTGAHSLRLARIAEAWADSYVYRVRNMLAEMLYHALAEANNMDDSDEPRHTLD